MSGHEFELMGISVMAGSTLLFIMLLVLLNKLRKKF